MLSACGACGICGLRGALCALVLCAARSLVCAGLAKRARGAARAVGRMPMRRGARVCVAELSVCAGAGRMRARAVLVRGCRAGARWMLLYRG